MFCPRCGVSISEDSQACSNCGYEDLEVSERFSSQWETYQRIKSEVFEGPEDAESFSEQSWEIEYLISEGPISEVYRVSGESKEARYVLKWFREDLFDGADAFERAKQKLAEWRDLSAGRNFGINDFGLEEGRLWVLVPFYEGIGLDEWVERGRSPEADLDDVAEVFSGIVERLKTFYRVSHRDYFGNLRPTNIFVGRHGKISLSDGWQFDVLPADKIETHFEESDFLAPEIKKRGEGHEYSDVFSLGRLLKWALAGDVVDMRAQSALNQYDFNDRQFVKIVTKSTALNEEERYPTIERFHQEVAALLSEEEVLEDPALTSEQSEEVQRDEFSVPTSVTETLEEYIPEWVVSESKRLGRDARIPLVLGGAVAVLILFIFGIWAFFSGDKEPEVNKHLDEAYGQVKERSASSLQKGLEAVENYEKAKREKTANVANEKIKSGLSTAYSKSEDYEPESDRSAGVGESSGSRREPGGQDSQRTEPIHCPDDMVRVGGRRGYFCIDAFEYPGKGQVPLRDITWFEAKNRCEAEGKDLCSLSQWRRACGARYSYGNSWDSDRCVTANKDGFGRSVAKSGSAGGCRSPVGAYDMVGNVFEWVKGQRIAGGSFENGPEMATCRYASRKAPGSSAANIGFRCCKTK